LALNSYAFQVLELFAKADNSIGNIQHNIQLLDEPWVVLRALLAILELCISIYYFLSSPHGCHAGVDGRFARSVLFLHYR
jgi:hypothetical protein